MAVFNLEHFPDVCRLCLKPESRKLHSIDDEFGNIHLQIKTFLEDVTFQLPEVWILVPFYIFEKHQI